MIFYIVHSPVINIPNLSLNSNYQLNQQIVCASFCEVWFLLESQSIQMHENKNAAYQNEK